jgi:hypothetical protein
MRSGREAQAQARKRVGECERPHGHGSHSQTLAMPRGHLASDVGKLSGLRFPAQATVGPRMAQPWVVSICRPPSVLLRSAEVALERPRH